MSWDADLYEDQCDHCGRGELIAEWNYTHNCNRMIEEALGSAVEGTTRPFWSKLRKDGSESPMGDFSWWDLLDGLSGAEGAALLDRLVTSLRSDPGRFSAMNPDNGWGSYETLLPVLEEMRSKSAANPEAAWRVSG